MVIRDTNYNVIKLRPNQIRLSYRFKATSVIKLVGTKKSLLFLSRPDKSLTLHQKYTFAMSNNGLLKITFKTANYLIDLGLNFRILPPDFNYMTAFLSFMWYGVAFYYHASTHGKEPVETIVHILPIYVMFMISLASRFKP